MASVLDDDEVVVGDVDDLAAAACMSSHSSGKWLYWSLLIGVAPRSRNLLIHWDGTGYHTSPLPLSDEEITLICRISPELSGDNHYDVKLAFKDQSTNHYHSDRRRWCRLSSRKIVVKTFGFFRKLCPSCLVSYSVGVFRPRSWCLFSTNSLTSGLELIPRCRQQTLWVRAFSCRNELDSSVRYSLFFLSTRCRCRLAIFLRHSECRVRMSDSNVLCIGFMNCEKGDCVHVVSRWDLWSS